MRGAAAQQVVSALFGSETLLGAELLAHGAAGSYYEFEHLGAVRAMMDQPIVTPNPLGGWLYSFMDYRFEQGRITPLRGHVAVGARVLGNGAASTLAVPSLREAALGAFQFDGGWTLTNPLESHALKGMIERRRQGR